MTSYLLPVVIGVVSIGFVILHRRRAAAAALGGDEWYESLRADKLAQRLGLAIVEGDPAFNLAGTQRQIEADGQTRFVLVPFVWKRSERRVQMVGAPGNRRTELVYHDVFARRDLLLWREWAQETEARITVEVETAFPDFEVFTRRPHCYVEPKPQASLPAAPFGDPLLDEAFVLRTSDPRVAPLLASAIRSIGDLRYVHVVGERGRISFVLTSATVSMFASGERILHVLDEAAHSIERFARGVPVAASPPRALPDRATGSRDEDNTPVPCRRCGAPMVEEPRGPHAFYGSAPAFVRCDYCQSREELPADAAQRVAALRERLAEIAWAQQAIEAPALAIARVAETYPRLVAPGVIGIAVVACLATVQIVVHALEAPLGGAARAALMLAALATPIRIGFVLTTVIGAAIIGLRRYAAELRPALEARPALHDNQYRCRRCGGAISPEARHGAFVTCPYCSAQNLLGKDTAAHRAAQLERELEEYRARARGQQPVLAAAAGRYQRRIQLVFGAVVVANAVFMLAVSALEQYLAGPAH